jgi:hypothetical protein
MAGFQSWLLTVMQAFLLAVIQSDTSDCLQDSFQDGLLASKHDFFLSGMISFWLSFTCTVQFLLSTAKGRCLQLQIHLGDSFFHFGKAARRAAFSFGLASISAREPGSFCPRRLEASAVLAAIQWVDFSVRDGEGPAASSPRAASIETGMAGRGLSALKNHAHVVQAWDEGRAVDLLAAGGAVAEADDVGRVLLQAALEGNPLGVEDEGDEARLAIMVIAHQNGELAAGG